MSAEEIQSEPTPATPISAGSAAGVSFIFGLVGVIFVFIFGAWNWSETKDFLAGGIIVAAVVTVGVGLLSRRASHAILALIISVAVAAPLLAWEKSEVRTEVLRIAGSVIPAITLRQALNDRDANVGTEACLALLGRGYDEIRHTSHEFAQSPETTMACLKGEVEGTDAEELLRRDVLWMWRDALLAGKSTNDDPCGLVEPYVALVPSVYPEDVAPRMLALSLASQSSEVRECMRAQFDEKYASPLKQLTGLGDPRRIEKKVQESLFADLVRASYAADLPKDAKRAVNNKMLEQWTLSLGCSVLDMTDDTSRAVRYLNTAMVAQGCGAVQEEEGSAAIWSEACHDSVDAKSGYVTQQDLCGRIRRHAVDASREFAHAIVWGGIDIMRWRALHDSVKAGGGMESARDAAQRFVPTDLMESTLENSSFSRTMVYDAMGGVHQTRRFSGEARNHMRQDKMNRGVDRRSMELFLAAAEFDAITVTDDEGKSVTIGDLKSQLKSQGVNVAEVFSQKNIDEATELVEDEKLDEESDLTVDELLNGLEPTDEEEAAREKKEREAKDPAMEQRSALFPQ